MEIIIKIEGMMCPHCEAHVKKALEAIDGVVSAEPSHKDNQAMIKLEKQIPIEVLHQAIIDAGYKIIQIFGIYPTNNMRKIYIFGNNSIAIFKVFWYNIFCRYFNNLFVK